MRQTSIPSCLDPQVIGIDDWAMKKGCRYGTIIVDLEKHQVIEVLPERDSETVSLWLQAHPSIEVVSRDRSTEYAAGIRMGAPHAIQVAIAGICC
jgi:transposase